MMKQGIEVWIVIPKPIPIFPRLMPELGKPLRARKYPQKMQNKTFYLVSVKEPGTSLKAAGWKCVGQAGGLRWTGKRRPEVDLCPAQMKIRFEREEGEKA